LNRNDGRALFSLALLDEYGRESAGDTFMRPQRELTNALTQYENYLRLRCIEQHLFQDMHSVSTVVFSTFNLDGAKGGFAQA